MAPHSTSAIDALQTYVATLTDAQKAEFAKLNGIDLNKINVLDYKTAEHICKHLNLQYGDNNVWSLYNKGKAKYEQETERYNIAQALYNGYKAEESRARNKYEALLAQLQYRKGEDKPITSTERSSIASKAGYTTKLIKSRKDAEIEMDLALDARFAAVDTQRHGLYYQG